MPFPIFDRSRLIMKPLRERDHDLQLSHFLQLDDPIPEFDHPTLDVLADRILSARARGATVMMMMGAHVLRDGTNRFLIELMRRGLVTHFAINGAGAIHDYELALIGETTESVARYVRTGEFGLWEETGAVNEAAKLGQREGIGLGEAVGKMIEEGNLPHKEVSLFAAGYRLQVPVTVHVSIGSDIVHEHPNCDGAAIGETSYRDFLIYAQSMTKLEGGVFLNFGSAVTGPEVYLKALTMARNVAHQEGKSIQHFSTAVFDLLPLEDEDYRSQAPKSDPRYYFRPWKTILVRTVADGGESFYVQGTHRETVTNLAQRLFDKQAESGVEA